MNVVVLLFLASSTDCGEPCSPTNGRVDGLDYSVGSFAVYTCDRGYQLDGVRRRRCEERLEWSGSCPRCAGR